MTLVRDVMTTSIVTVGPDAPFGEMVRLLLDHRIGAVLVVDPVADRLVGIVTEADLLAKQAYGARPLGDLALMWEESAGWGAEWMTRSLGVTASEVMSSPVVFTVPDASMAEAARLMLERHLKHLPVVRGGRVVGILGRSDLLRPFERGDAQVAAEVAEVMAAASRMGEPLPDVAVRHGVVVLSPVGRDVGDLAELEQRLMRVPGVVGVRVGAAPPAG
ncbi:MAG TPA: CBS domain-containing protein [Acidimicrobiales bacterium]|nr:CBS domain-containing protein [Acidimicrobiales bacterium]